MNRMKKEYAKGYETFEDFKEGYKKFIMKLEKMTGQPIEQFVSEYEFYREVIRNSFYNGTLYRVEIELTKEGIEAGVMDELLESNYLLSKRENGITLLWEVPINEGLYEIEIALFYILKDALYGSYSISDCVLAEYRYED